MASVRFRKEHNYFEIRKYVTDPRTRKPITFCEILPATATQSEIGQVADRLDKQAAAIKAGHGRIPDTVQRVYNEWARVIANHPVGRKRKLLTERTQQYYKYVLAGFLDTIPSRVRKITQLTPSHVEQYNTKLLNRGLTLRTVNANLTAIKSFARWVAESYGVENFAAEVLMYHEAEPDRRFLTDTEYPQIIAAGSTLFRQRFEFIANTGLRASEFSQLRWSDIAPNRSSIRVLGKGNKTRHVPLNSVCGQILTAIKDQTPPEGANTFIFMSKSRQPVSRFRLYGQCCQLNEKLNLEPFGPHAFRHYFATELLVKGVPVAHVSKILGHASIRTTESVYAHILPTHLQGLTECLCN